ncbi:inhibitor of apoptosis-promoting bax1 domain-containing protein [Ditylenchus destructor]|nr:inhibitor of apoptosis-promoting bax1 domain-containing protein [Ditylenchus destructor]
MTTSPRCAENGVPKHEFGFSDQTIRAAFIRKVFFIVGIMLAIVVVMSAIPFIHQPTLTFVHRHPAVYFLSYGTFLTVYIVLMCCENVRRSFPSNIICTGLLTLAIGYTSMMICAMYQSLSVVMCLTISTLFCGAIIIFSSQTKYDLTSLMGIVFIASTMFMIIGLVAMVSVMAFRIRLLYTIYAGVAALLFMLHLTIDIEGIMGSRKYEISPEDHIFASIQIFLDITSIFCILLTLCGSHKILVTRNMKIFHLCILLNIFLCISGHHVPFDNVVENSFKQHLPNPHKIEELLDCDKGDHESFVCDPDEVLSNSENVFLTRFLDSLEADTRNPFGLNDCERKGLTIGIAISKTPIFLSEAYSHSDDAPVKGGNQDQTKKESSGRK